MKMLFHFYDGFDTVAHCWWKPMINATNHNHVMYVWGDRAVVEVEIPGVNDDYSYFMLGKTRQISWSHVIDLHSCQTWVSILLHCLEIIHVNSYVFFCVVNGKKINFFGGFHCIIEWKGKCQKNEKTWLAVTKTRK